MEGNVFKSRVSVLLMGFVLAIFALPFVLSISRGDFKSSSFYVFYNSSAFYVAVVIYTLTLAFVFYIIFGMSYELTEKHLNFKMWGDTDFKIPLSAIVSVERSYNPLSCPAASLKRLKIRFKEGYKVPNIVPYALASPVCEQEFLETLKKYNPDIYIRVNDKKGWHRIYRFWDWDI